MNKFSTIATVVLTLMLLFFSVRSFMAARQSGNSTLAPSSQNVTYRIGDKDVTLTNGIAVSKDTTGASATSMIKYFGNEVMADIDGDGRMDSVFYLTEQTGGSGTFYYVVVALNKLPRSRADEVLVVKESMLSF